jgi:hypothetical protein
VAPVVPAQYGLDQRRRLPQHVVDSDMDAIGSPRAARPRLMLQYLEPGPATEAAEPAALRDHLLFALELLRPTDIAFGWRLSPGQVSALRPAVPDGVTVWRWVPMLAHAGAEWATHEQLQVGPDGRSPEPFRAMADFRFLCPNHVGVIDASVGRAVGLAREIDAAGVLLDRIRWHSPSQAPAAELTCFCDRSRALARDRGIDLDAARLDLELAPRSVAGRIELVQGLLGQRASGNLEAFLQWRTERMTEVIAQLAGAIREVGLRTALDVFTPALARSVGQDLGAIAAQGEWTKSMTYFDAFGPATMPYELLGYRTWLGELGEGRAAEVVAGSIGFAPPGLQGPSPQLEALETEIGRVVEAVGNERAVLGFDAVELPGVCDVRDEDLDARLARLRAAHIGLAPSWDLLAISRSRLERMATELTRV